MSGSAYECPMCTWDQPEYLGALGMRWHLRCRCCGWLWSIADPGEFLDVDRCPDCGVPTHATEGTEEGLCEDCARARYGKVVRP